MKTLDVKNGLPHRREKEIPVDGDGVSKDDTTAGIESIPAC